MASLTTETANALLDLTQGENPMVMYKNGRMYYYTPIYHLSSKSIANDVIPEGYYGVVRNHWYGLTITGFRKSKDDDPYNPSILPVMILLVRNLMVLKALVRMTILSIRVMAWTIPTSLSCLLRKMISTITLV
jgi:hypothetical protein